MKLRSCWKEHAGSEVLEGACDKGEDCSRMFEIESSGE